MVVLHPQFVTDHQGHQVAVVLPADEYRALLADLEDLEDARALEQAKTTSTGTVPWEQVKADLATMP